MNSTYVGMWTGLTSVVRSQYTLSTFAEHLDHEGVGSLIGTTVEACKNAPIENVVGLSQSDHVRTTALPVRFLSNHCQCQVGANCEARVVNTLEISQSPLARSTTGFQTRRLPQPSTENCNPPGASRRSLAL